MKTNKLNQVIRSVLLTMSVALTMFGCSKNNSSGTTTATAYQYNTAGQCIQTSTGTIVTTSLCQTSITGYGYNVSGQCIQTATGQIVATTLCQTSTVNGYQYVNGQCIQTSTGQIVQTALCSGTTTGAATSQVCNGPYVDVRYGTQGICSGAQGQGNCSGLQMLSLQTNQLVYCL